jgi:hypothetical protein
MTGFLIEAGMGIRNNHNPTDITLLYVFQRKVRRKSRLVSAKYEERDASAGSIEGFEGSEGRCSRENDFSMREVEGNRNHQSDNLCRQKNFSRKA